jgi:hypothetical protein
MRLKDSSRRSDSLGTAVPTAAVCTVRQAQRSSVEEISRLAMAAMDRGGKLLYVLKSMRELPKDAVAMGSTEPHHPRPPPGSMREVRI